MNNDTKYKISVMQAFEDGKEIEARLKGQWCWESVTDPAWDWERNEYRIKPEPKYVPYDSVAEVDKDKWLERKVRGRLYRIIGLDTHDNTVRLDYGWCKLVELFELFTYADGTPCGKLEE